MHEHWDEGEFDGVYGFTSEGPYVHGKGTDTGP